MNLVAGAEAVIMILGLDWDQTVVTAQHQKHPLRTSAILLRLRVLYMFLITMGVVVVAQPNLATSIARSKATATAVGQRSTILVQLHAHVQPTHLRLANRIAIFVDTLVVRSFRPQPQAQQPRRQRQPLALVLAATAVDASSSPTNGVRTLAVRSKAKV